MRSHRGTARFPVVLAISAALLLEGAPAATEAPAARAPAADLIEVFARTLVVGPDGTRTAGRDRALLAPDKSGLLRVTVELAGEETVALELKVRYSREPDDAADSEDPTAAMLRIHSTAQAEPSGGIVMRSGGGFLELPGSMLHEAFVSSASGERVVVNLEAVPWRDPGPPLRAVPPMDVKPVSYRISIYRSTPTGLDFLGRPELHSLVGRSVSYGFGFALGEAGSANATSEAMELTIHGVELRDGNLTGTMTLTGDLRGKEVSTSRGWSLRSGQQERMTFRFGEIGGEERGGVMVLEAVF